MSAQLTDEQLVGLATYYEGVPHIEALIAEVRRQREVINAVRALADEWDEARDPSADVLRAALGEA